jgi:hypothetical protein
MTNLAPPLECPAPPGPRGPCTGSNFLPVDPAEVGQVHRGFTNMQVGARAGGMVMLNAVAARRLWDPVDCPRGCKARV